MPPASNPNEELFYELVFQNFSNLIQTNSAETFKLIESFFKNDIERIVDCLDTFPEEQFHIIDSTLTTDHDLIQSLIERHLVSALENESDKEKAKLYMRLQQRHFTLMC